MGEKAACSYTHTENSVHLFSPGVELAALQSVSSASTPGLKELQRSTQYHPQTIPMPSAGPQATPSHFSLIPTLLAWRKDKPCMETVARPSSQLGLFLQGFWCPQGHTARSGNYSSGQLSLAFLSSESCVFLPLFGGGSVAGQPSRASLQREAQPSSLALLTGAGLSSCPSSLSGPQGDRRGWTLSCLGRELTLCFSFQSPREEFVLRCFCSWSIFLPWS